MGTPDPMSEDFEFLSLFIEEAMNGVDVAARYPGYYRRLISNPLLRQAFLDVLQLMETDLAGLPEPAQGSLAFLLGKKQKGESWRVQVMRSMQQLQEIFSPPQPAYRAAGDLDTDGEIIILQDEFTRDEIRYSISMACTLSESAEHELDIWLNIGIAPDKEITPPIEITLHWGEYRETMLVAGDGRHSLPPIPLDTIFDESIEQIKSALEMTIEVV